METACHLALVVRTVFVHPRGMSPPRLCHCAAATWPRAQARSCSAFLKWSWPGRWWQSVQGSILQALMALMLLDHDLESKAPLPGSSEILFYKARHRAKEQSGQCLPLVGQWGQSRAESRATLGVTKTGPKTCPGCFSRVYLTNPLVRVLKQLTISSWGMICECV